MVHAHTYIEARVDLSSEGRAAVLPYMADLGESRPSRIESDLTEKKKGQ